MNTFTGKSANDADENDLLQKQRETFVASLSHDLKNGRRRVMALIRNL